MSKNKEKTVHLEDQTHKKLKRKAADDGTTIKKLVDDFVNEGLKEEELKDEK